MNRWLTQFLANIDRLGSLQGQSNQGVWREVLPSDHQLSPWAAWTLVCLVRHRRRQAWVATTITTQFGADLLSLAKAGAFGHPDVPQRGLVPQTVEWEYYFHGRGCCFSHRVTGETIDVDFLDETFDWFEPFFFVQYLKSLKSPRAFPEERVLTLHGAADVVPLKRSCCLARTATSPCRLWRVLSIRDWMIT